MDITDSTESAKPQVIGIDPRLLLIFIESSNETLNSIKNQIQLAKRKYGVAFGGVDQTIQNGIYFDDYQLNLIEFLRKNCQIMVSKVKS